MKYDKYKIAIISSHPIQYFTPLYKKISQNSNIELMVYYCSTQGLYTYNDSGFGQDIKWDTPLLDGYQYQFLKNYRKKENYESMFSFVNLSIIDELRSNKYDAIWINGHNIATNIIAIIAAKIFGIKVLMRSETHLMLQRSWFKRLFRKAVISFLYKLVDGFLAIGTKNKEFYLSLGINPSKVFMTPYSVDNDRFTVKFSREGEKYNEIRNALSLPVGKTVILYLSKLTSRKRPMDLLVAYERLRKTQNNIALVFVGSGAEEFRLRNYVEIQEIKDVYFCGFQNQTDLPKYFAASDIFVLPSEQEPWGLVVNEAMASALPIIISSDVGSAFDLVVPNCNGYHYNPRDIDQLVNYLQKLVNDKDLRTTMGQKSLSLINEWSYEQCVKGLYLALVTTCKDNSA